MHYVSFPVKNPIISQKFGEDNTNHPIRKNFYSLFANKHPGVDFKLNVSTPILASYPGIVVRREVHKGMGLVIGTRYGNIVVLYAHLSKFKVDLGQKLEIGMQIGLSGDSGEACDEPHLHFEMRDITKKDLKDMVFDPPFGGPVLNQKSEFTYVVKNDNTVKTLTILANRYFGSAESEFIKLFKARNPLVSDLSPDDFLEDGLELLISNYSR